MFFIRAYIYGLYRHTVGGDIICRSAGLDYVRPWKYACIMA
ncbi:hypothetical protein [Dialister invisus]